MSAEGESATGENREAKDHPSRTAQFDFPRYAACPAGDHFDCARSGRKGRGRNLQCGSPNMRSLGDEVSFQMLNLSAEFIIVVCNGDCSRLELIRKDT